MTIKIGLGRKIIEGLRKGFNTVGVDVHRHTPNPKKTITRVDIFNALTTLRHESHHRPILDEEEKFLQFCSLNQHQSRAQLFQDLFVLYALQGKRGGYFVEFGATDGVQINNTVLLERNYGWAGVVAEPARFWHERLHSNRKCFISTDCVWRTSGKILTFNETPDRELSTINELSESDDHRSNRVNGERYQVHTVSLMDLLGQANAPTIIDYMSIDTEGSEFEILNAFDFQSYDVRVFTVEHNYTHNRAKLHDLFTRNGYIRKFETLSQWDDWYVR